jgi:hypothetical protein
VVDLEINGVIVAKSWEHSIAADAYIDVVHKAEDSIDVWGAIFNLKLPKEPQYVILLT